MLSGRSLFQMARRHVAEAEFRVERQRQLIERLRGRGAPTALAEDVLAAFTATMEQMRRHRDLLEGGPRDG